IGMAVGAGAYVDALGTTALVMVVLYGLGYVERFAGRHLTRSHLLIHARPEPQALEELETLVRRAGVEIERTESRRENVDLVVEVQAPAASDGDGGSGTPEAAAAARGAEIYLGYGVPAGVVAAGRGSLRWVHSGTAGIGASLPHLAGTDVVLTNSAAVHAEPIADWAIAAIGYFARGLDRMREFQAAERWARPEVTDLHVPVREFADLRLGVFGLGGVGAAIARRAVALGMHVIGIRRRPERGGPRGVAWVGDRGALPR